MSLSVPKKIQIEIKEKLVF